MKKNILFALSFIVPFCLNAATGYTCGSNGLDGELFLDPHVGNLADASTTLSVNVGCHLPSTMHVISTDICKEIGFGAHFKKMAEQVASQGQVVVAVPASYDVVFTDDSCSQQDALNHIDQVLSSLPENPSQAQIAEALASLSEITRATFVVHDGRLALVTNEKQLSIGEPVWRKELNNVESQVFHSEEEYLVAFTNAGFQVDEVKRPCFSGELRYKMHQSSLEDGQKGLGRSYIDHHPFTIFYLKKPA